MLQEALHLLKTKKFIIQATLFFLFFMFVYSIVDYLNLPYPKMVEQYGLFLVIINILINLIMSIGSAILMNLSTINVQLKGRDSVGSNLGFISVLFGILTYGCTSCVIAFFASIGIAFSVVALPFAGLPYKLVSLLLIVVGLLWMIRDIKKGYCKIPLK